MAEFCRVEDLFESGYLKSLFAYSSCQSLGEMKEELLKFAKLRKFPRSDIKKVTENIWSLEITEEKRFPIKGRKEYRTEIPHYFYIILHDGFWEFHTNERREALKIIEGLINFSAKLEYKFVSPNQIMSLAREYVGDDLDVFTARRSYFTLEKASPEFRVISDDVRLSLSSSPRNIWDHYHQLIDEETLGPLSIGSVRVTIPLDGESCSLWINTAGEISQVAGSREIFHRVREQILDIFENQMKWEKYIPKIEPQVIRDEEREITIRGRKEARKGGIFVTKLSKPFEKKRYEVLKSLFTSNAKNSEFVGTVEEEDEEKKSFAVRTTDMKGGGDASITARVGESSIPIHPLPTTSLRVIEKIYKVILEKFDTKAILESPKG